MEVTQMIYSSSFSKIGDDLYTYVYERINHDSKLAVYEQNNIYDGLVPNNGYTRIIEVSIIKLGRWDPGCDNSLKTVSDRHPGGHL